MAAFNFPASPSNGDTYTLNSVTYQYDGTKWVRYSAAVGAQGSTGSTGAQGASGSAGSTGIPSGFIGLWSGASNAIPSGWYLCDGNNSTPDLRDKFIIGAGNSYAVDATGGSKDAVVISHSHTINNHTHSFSGNTGNQSANHTHSFSGSGSSSHSHGISPVTHFDSHNNNQRKIQSGRNNSNTNYGISNDFTTNSANVSISISGNTGGISANHAHSFSGSTGNPSDRGTDTQGVSGTDKNLPPYYALCYIMKS